MERRRFRRRATRGSVRVSTHPSRRGGVIAGHRRPFDSPENLLRPSGAKREKRVLDPFPSSAFHGFRVGPPCGRAAPPVATIRRPVGAEKCTPQGLGNRHEAGLPGNRGGQTVTSTSPRRGRMICSLGREPVERYAKRSPVVVSFEPHRGD